MLARLTTFVGGGGPRFCFSVGPELQQLNYAQILVQVKDKHDTGALVPRLQKALSADVRGARIDARQLETAEGSFLAVRRLGLLIGQGDSSVPVFDTAAIHARAAGGWRWGL